MSDKSIFEKRLRQFAGGLEKQISTDDGQWTINRSQKQQTPGGGCDMKGQRPADKISGYKNKAGSLDKKHYP